MKRLLFTAMLVLLPSISAANDMLRERITLAEQQALLSQRMMRNMCFVKLRVDTSRNKQSLLTSKYAFDAVVKALKSGGGAQGLGPETDVKTLRMIARVDRLWKEFNTRISQFNRRKLREPNDLLESSDLSIQLAKASEELKEIYVERYKDQSMFAAMIPRTMTDVANRQAMLVQKAGKEVCLSVVLEGESNHGVAQNALENTLDLFDRSAFGLTFSSAAMQLPVPPSADIEEDNFANWQQWNAAAPLFYMGLDGNQTEDDLYELSFTIEYMSEALHETALKYNSL